MEYEVEEIRAVGSNFEVSWCWTG